jgi:hypothetical protein
MDKKIINEEQFKKLVISEAQKIMSEESSAAISGENSEPKSKRKVTFSNVESLIKEMEKMPKSILSISKDVLDNSSNEGEIKETWVPNKDRDLDPITHNQKKNIMHVNETEKDKWKRMLGYNIPSDEER